MSLDNHPPLFHRAIIESGANTSRVVHQYNAAIHEKQFEEFVQAAGCADRTVSEIMTCLRHKPSETITNASFTVFDRYNPSIRWAFQPVVDGDTIKRPPIDAWHSGEWNWIRILTGFNMNEGTYYVPELMSMSEEFTAFFHTLLPAYTEEDIQTIDKLYLIPQLIFLHHTSTRGISLLDRNINAWRQLMDTTLMHVLSGKLQRSPRPARKHLSFYTGGH